MKLFLLACGLGLTVAVVNPVFNGLTLWALAAVAATGARAYVSAE